MMLKVHQGHFTPYDRLKVYQGNFTPYDRLKVHQGNFTPYDRLKVQQGNFTPYDRLFWSRWCWKCSRVNLHRTTDSGGQTGCTLVLYFSVYERCRTESPVDRDGKAHRSFSLSFSSGLLRIKKKGKKKRKEKSIKKIHLWNSRKHDRDSYHWCPAMCINDVMNKGRTSRHVRPNYQICHNPSRSALHW